MRLTTKRVWAAPAAIMIGVAAGAFGAARPAIGALPVTISGHVCTVVGTEGNDVLSGTAATDVICGLGGNDVLVGSDGNDVLLGGPGRDLLSGGAGNDVLMGGAGADTLRGGVGIDTASWADHAGSVEVDLDGVADDGAPGERDNAGADIENIVGGSGPDILVGSDGPNVIAGLGGRDLIKGKGGKDVVDGGAGDNTIDGGDGVDVIRCGPGKTMVIDGLGDVQGADCKKIIKDLPLFTGRVTAYDPTARTLTISSGAVAIEPWISSTEAASWMTSFAPTVGGATSVSFNTRVAATLRLPDGDITVGDQVVVTAVPTTTYGLAALAILATPTA